MNIVADINDVFNRVLHNLCGSFDNWSYNGSFWTYNAMAIGLHLLLVTVLLLLTCMLLIWVDKYVRFVDRMSRHLPAMAVVVWLIGIVVYVVGFYGGTLTGLAVVPRAVISSFKMFVVSHDLARVYPVLQRDALYMSVFSLVHFVAAFITFLFIFKMMGYKIRNSWRIRKKLWSGAKIDSLHLFWGVNDASCRMAKEVRQKLSDAVIVFIDIDNEDDEVAQKNSFGNVMNMITLNSRMVERLEEVKGVYVGHCYNGPAVLNDAVMNDSQRNNGKVSVVFNTLNINCIGRMVLKSTCRNFYFLSEDEKQNIAGALVLQQDKALCDGKTTKIYVHARRIALNEVIDHYSQYQGGDEELQLNLKDSSFLAIEALKQNENALPVNCVKVDKKSGVVTTPFTAMVVGFGATGLEAFKFLYEFATFIGPDMKKSPFKCYAIDERMKELAGLVRAKMPAIGEDELTLIDASVDSTVFWDTIKKIVNELNYVVIALNNDNIGLSLAINMFKYALHHRNDNSTKLKIMVRIYDAENMKRMEKVKKQLNNLSTTRNIEMDIFGEENDIYSYPIIIEDKVLKDAMEFHRVYVNEEKSTWNSSFGEAAIDVLMKNKGISRYYAIYDINRQIIQSKSNSLHCRTKMLLMGFDELAMSERLKLYVEYVNKRKSMTTHYECPETDATLLRNIAIVEHERWIAMQKLMGYTYAPKRNYITKQHEYMCEWDGLKEDIQSYDCNVVDTTIKLAYQEALSKSK